MKFYKILQCYLLITWTTTSVAQIKLNSNTKSTSNKPVTKLTPLFTSSLKSNSLFGNSFIENIGQFDSLIKNKQIANKIQFAFDGFDMPVLFTKNEVVFLQRQMKKLSHREAEKLEKRKNGIEEFLQNNKPVYKQINMEWIGANEDVEILVEEQTQGYHTYGLLKGKAKGYGKITYKNIYPDIDVVYSFINGDKVGFEYSIVVHPGADASLIKMRYNGDVEKIKEDKSGNLLLTTAISGIIQSTPKSYTCLATDKLSDLSISNAQTKISSSFTIKGNEVSFNISDNYDKTKTLVIDPFISSTTILTGANAGKATDIDFDYDGNIYVSSKSPNFSKLAKFNNSGTLIWIYDRITPLPAFIFSYGGWVVEKKTGKVYLGQGFNAIGGTQVIRLNASGIYDNYATTQVFEFAENWKMIWNCSNSQPQILLGGGTVVTNANFAIIQPPNPIITPINITGIPFSTIFGNGTAQDAVDVIVDPATDEMYSTYASVGTPQVRNKIYKHSPPYTAASIVWQAPTGYNNLFETGGRPYLISPITYGGADNSMNLLAINRNYLFYWDGKNLKAFNKASGAVAGTPLTTPLAEKMQGGIYADECDNVFVGYANGLVKVFKFTGTNFDDNAATDITIAGYPTASVYDLAYNPTDKILYASGNGFVASFDIDSYCPSTSIYSLRIVADCPNNSIRASLIPTPPPTTIVTYSLFNGTNSLSSNTTGIFLGLSPSILYTLKATVNENCGGIRVVKDFSYPETYFSLAHSDTICSGLSTVLKAVSNAATVLWTPTTGLSNPNILQPTASPLTTTKYFITATNGICSILDSVTVFVKPSPAANAGNDTTICFAATIQLQGSGGNSSYRWSPSIFLSSTSVPNPFLSNASASLTYTLLVKNTNGCSKTDKVNITVLRQPKLFVGNDTFIVAKQPVYLFAKDLNNTGFTKYLWQPATDLTSPILPNPIAKPDRDITYFLTATTPEGCIGTDEIAIKVFKKIEIYVPNAFTPNGDSRNDKLFAIPVGITKFNYFRIYNRYGNLVFSTTDFRTGWDGKLASLDQTTGTFVWMAEGIDYLGNVVNRKGTTVLIR